MIVILDAGHGGWLITPEHPQGYYPTRGKRSPIREDGTVLYEGVNNRRIVKALIEAFKRNQIEWFDVVDTQEDKSLRERVKTANKVYGERLYLSIHSNAAGNSGWSTARGFGTYIYTGASKKSRAYAEIMHECLVEELGDLTKDRGIRERNFYVLRETNHPAILLELGFHNNLEESYLIESEEWSDRVCKAIVKAIKQING